MFNVYTHAMPRLVMCLLHVSSHILPGGVSFSTDFTIMRVSIMFPVAVLEVRLRIFKSCCAVNVGAFDCVLVLPVGY